jgi:hypothetical protein
MVPEGICMAAMNTQSRVHADDGGRLRNLLLGSFPGSEFKFFVADHFAEYVFNLNWGQSQRGLVHDFLGLLRANSHYERLWEALLVERPGTAILLNAIRHTIAAQLESNRLPLTEAIELRVLRDVLSGYNSRADPTRPAHKTQAFVLSDRIPTSSLAALDTKPSGAPLPFDGAWLRVELIRAMKTGIFDPQRRESELRVLSTLLNNAASRPLRVPISTGTARTRRSRLFVGIAAVAGLVGLLCFVIAN